jgi:hypothetical protein
MPSVIDNRKSNTIDKTIRIFDSFYSFNLIVNPNEYDIVHSYFTSICDSVNIADNFTVILFRISQQTQIPVLDLLTQLKGKKNMEINQILAYYLNSFKSKTTLYGTSVLLRPNQTVARNIVQ